jgi:hypothetical protein
VFAMRPNVGLQAINKERYNIANSCRDILARFFDCCYRRSDVAVYHRVPIISYPPLRTEVS